MKSITQEDFLGCAAACAAFVSGKSYKEVALLLGLERVKFKGCFCKDLVQLLSELGHPYSYKYIKQRLRRKIYENGVIVFVKKSKKYPAGHFLVRYGFYWMDPWINFSPDMDVENAKSGFRKKLPGKPIYALFPENRP